MRAILTTLAFLSFVTLVGIAAMWLRSYAVDDDLAIDMNRGGSECHVYSSCGKIIAMADHHYEWTLGRWEYAASGTGTVWNLMSGFYVPVAWKDLRDKIDRSRSRAKADWSALGVEYLRWEEDIADIQRGHELAWAIIIPYWMPALAASVLPICWLPGFARRYRMLRRNEARPTWIRSIVRGLFTAAAAILAVLLIAVVLQCVRSYWVIDRAVRVAFDETTVPFYFGDGSDCGEIESEGGEVRVSVTGRWWDAMGWSINSHRRQDTTPLVGLLAPPATTASGDRSWSWGGFGYGWLDAQPTEEKPWRLSLRCPFWAVASLLAIVPMFWLLMFRRRWRGLKRAARGLCAGCAYDLTPTNSQACPECGMKKWELGRS